MKKKFYKYNPKDQELFKDVVFIVECTLNEQQTFWRDYHYKPIYPDVIVKSWAQDQLGYTIQIGQLDDRPINICIFFATLDGKKVMFYEAISQVVDYEMVEKWMDHFSKDIRWDISTRRAKCDSSNFHHCLNAIKELNEA